MVICDKCDFLYFYMCVHSFALEYTFAQSSLFVLFLSYLFHLCLEISRSTPQFNKIEEADKAGLRF